MRHVPRTALAVAFVMAFVPLTAFADGPAQPQPYTNMPAALVQLDSAHDAIAGSSTPVDVANATERYNVAMGAALGLARANLSDAQGFLSLHPADMHAQAEVANALAAYNQTLEFCGFTAVPAETFGLPTATVSADWTSVDLAQPAAADVAEVDRGGYDGN